MRTGLLAARTTRRVVATSIQHARRLIRAALCWIVWLNGTLAGHAAVAIIDQPAAVACFGDGRRVIQTQIHSSEDRSIEVDLRYRLHQSSGSTLVPLGGAKSWKTLTLTPNQTVVETLEVEFPSVRGETAFRIAWYDGETRLGITPVIVFPAGLLQPLTVLAGETSLGLIDPEGRFSAALGALPRQELKEAEDVAAADISLILVAPMNKESRPAGLAAALKKKASEGCLIVWIQPVSPPSVTLPAVHAIDEGSGRIVVATAATVSDLADSPRAQLNLVQLAELAAGKRRIELPIDD